MQFEKTIEIINNQKFQDIKDFWPSIELCNILNKEVSFDKKMSGVYALYHDDYNFIYIGKAKSIFDRLKSHYYATIGREKSECWSQFFGTINTGIWAYWYQTKDQNLDNSTD